MNCPRTGKPMEEIEIGGVKVDVSTGCGGIFFDNFELKKFDEPFEAPGEQLIAASQKYSDESVDTSPRINCPHHPDCVMMRHSFSVKQAVEIDECPQCGGIWLDPGELGKVRALFPSEEAKSRAADEMFEKMFQSPEMQAMKSKSDADLAKAKRFARMFRFICPSNYIPGKQDWGAF